MHAQNIIEAKDAQLTAFDVINVTAGRAGRIVELTVVEGDSVTLDQPIARLDDRRAILDVKLAKHELSVARTLSEDDIEVRHAAKSLELARTEEARADASNEQIKGATPEREVDRLRLTTERAELAVERSRREQDAALEAIQLKQLQLEIAELELQQHRIAASAAGLVVKSSAKLGEWVEPGATIIEIAMTGQLRAEGFISADDALEDLRGAPAAFTVPMKGQAPLMLRGVVTFVSPDANPVNGAVRVRAEFAAPNIALRPGLAGTLQIKRGSKAATTTPPAKISSK